MDYLSSLLESKSKFCLFMNIQIGAAILALRVSQWWYAQNSVGNEFPDYITPRKYDCLSVLPS